MPRIVRGTAVFAVLVIGCFSASLGQGISANALIGPLEYSQFTDLQSDQIWLLLDQAEYWAVPLTSPADYYESVQTSSKEVLRSSLHELIDGHTMYAYSTTETPDDPGFEIDTWDIIALADAHPDAPSYVLDIYLNGTFDRQAKGAAFSRHYDREHSWPRSLGFSNKSSPAYTDCHHLFAAYSSYNSSRGNKPYGSCDQGNCKPTEENLGRGGEDVCCMSCMQVWQPWEDRRGDVARAMFYMVVRYEGDAAKEPDLELTDDIRQIDTCSAWKTQDTAFMGLLSVLLEGHAAVPVDDLERRRNTVVFLFQGNRNLFVDHPEWVSAMFASPS
jgi:endonuclease I